MGVIKFKTIAFLFPLFFMLPQWLGAVEGDELQPGYVNPGYEEKPDWFKISFLDVYEDIADAADKNKRLMLYFYQDGCPYCKKLLEDNFGQRVIADKTRKYFDVVAINIWGGSEVIVDENEFTETEFAAALKVQYTPTLLFFNEDNKVVYRANGYYPPEKFHTVLDYVGQKMEAKLSYQDYLAKVDPQPATGKLYTDVINIKDPRNLKQALSPEKPLLVMFEQKQCAACDELHNDMLNRSEGKQQLSRFNVALLDMWSEEKIVSPDGKKVKIRDWVKQLDVKYAPSMVYFDAKGKEVFRTDAYLKSFHVQSVMDYVASGAYQRQPNFQVYIGERADALRAQGIEVDLMK
ncbi:MAG: thioredoxin fold domain-containing protein [Gammaproteobacteria bacterium]|nr:thioredoxin fold domain-containing protein [Gammaproteobacteria bacterium]MCW8923550.1 thioredoxin fold domain-containing protein [Gammaproteobacteria bacterium]